MSYSVSCISVTLTSYKENNMAELTEDEAIVQITMPGAQL